jgi:hypothetical protein
MLRAACLTAIVMTLAAAAQSQMPKTLPNPINPDPFNRDIEQRKKIEDTNDRHNREREAVPPEVAKFMAAIKPRKHLFADFDRVVLNGKAPMTLSLLSLIAESPYAADIAYYLNKHPEQSGSIAQMQPEQARNEVQKIEASVAADNSIRK